MILLALDHCSVAKSVFRGAIWDRGMLIVDTLINGECDGSARIQSIDQSWLALSLLGL
jgi:hypothetical protein